MMSLVIMLVEWKNMIVFNYENLYFEFTYRLTEKIRICTFYFQILDISYICI